MDGRTAAAATWICLEIKKSKEEYGRNLLMDLYMLTKKQFNMEFRIFRPTYSYTGPTSLTHFILLISDQVGPQIRQSVVWTPRGLILRA